MLDHVERRRLLVEPAGEDPLEPALGVAHVDLDEGAGQLLHLPGGGGLAGAQADDHVADPDRLARLQREIARQAVALVEQAQHRRPLRHRRGSGRDARDRLRDVDGLRLGFGHGVATGGLVAAAAGQSGQPGERGSGSAGGEVHSASGVQA